jgi:hypothetical protein
MQIIFYAMVVCIFCVDWLADKLSLLPHSATYYAEGFAVVFMLAATLIVAQRRKFDIDLRIAVILILIIVSFVASAVSNQVATGVLIGGVRIHLKFLPFLILPLVYQFSDDQVRRQLYFILALTLIQTPIAFYQRFVKYADVDSGDPIGGTLGANASGLLSVWLACTITVVFSFFLMNRIGPKTIIMLLIALSAPMMINETKISFFLIPVALIIPAVFANRGGSRIVRLAMTAGATFLVLLILVTVYDALKPNKKILEWFTSDDATQYVYKGTATGGERKEVRRLDAPRIAYKHLQYENAFLFGLGPGNLSPAFDPRFEGKYFRRYEHFQPKKVQMSLSLWETGFVGTSLIIALMLGCGLISYRLTLMDQHDQYQALALGWIGVTTILLLNLLYMSAFANNLFVFFYWFYSGVIIARLVNIREKGSPTTNSTYMRNEA